MSVNFNVIRRNFTIKVASNGTSVANAVHNINAHTSDNGVDTDGLDAPGPSNATPAHYGNRNAESANDSIDNRNTPTGSNPWMDVTFRATRTPPTSLGKICPTTHNTFPKRSQRSKVFRGRLGTLCRRNKKRVRKAHSSSKKTKGAAPMDEVQEYTSDENVPILKRRRLFLNENCGDNGLSIITPKIHREDEPHETIQTLKAALQHYREVNDFHLKSRCSFAQTEETFNDDSSKMKLQLLEKDKHIEQLAAEIAEMKKMVKDLQDKLEASHKDGQLLLNDR